MNKLKFIVVIIPMIIGFFVSCSVNQEIAIAVDGSGEVQVEVALSPLIMQYYGDLNGIWVDDYREIQVIDPAEISQALAIQQGMAVEIIDASSNEKLSFSGRLHDPERIIPTKDGEYSELIRFRRDGRESELSIRFNRQTILDLLSMTTFADSALAEYLLPPKEEAMDEQEYLEYLVWALEEYEEPEIVRAVIEKSGISVEIKVPNEIVAIQGGEIANGSDGKRAVFFVPFIKALTTSRDLVYTVRYR